MDATCQASSGVNAKTDTQSRLRQAGTTPRDESQPLVGFKPLTLQKLAGTRPEPAVSVPSEKGTCPVESNRAANARKFLGDCVGYFVDRSFVIAWRFQFYQAPDDYRTCPRARRVKQHIVRLSGNLVFQPRFD